MTVITAGLYKVTLHQEFSAQAVQNVFFYEHTLASDDEQEECATAFDEDLLPALKLIQSVDISYVTIRAANVTGTLADFIKEPATLTGVLTGSALNSFTAASIRLNRTTKETRNGQKRFAGMTEENAFGQNWTASYSALLDTFAIVLASQISTVGAIFNPVIARQDPITPANWTVNPIAGASASGQVSSQTSRKSARV